MAGKDDAAGRNCEERRGMMITQLEFEENVGKFQNFEDLRSKIADSVPNLLSKGFEIEAYSESR